MPLFRRPALVILSALVFTLIAAAQQSSSDPASQLNDAVHREHTWSNDPNAKQEAAPQHARAGSAVGALGTSIEPNEAVFTVMAGLNACGYDAGLAHAGPIRLRVRSKMQQEVAASADAKAARDSLCEFVRQHDLGEPAKTVGQYLSLALMMQPTADLEISTSLPQLPPDALRVAGVVPALRKFAEATRLHAIWINERSNYEQALQPLRDPLTRQIFAISLYLRETESGSPDRRFVVIVEPMLSTGLVNARVYGLDYLMVLAPPQTEAELRRFTDDVKHFYLDFAIAPLIFGYPGAMERLQPLLRSVAEAPMEAIYRDDVEALVSECLIRAIEARTMDTGIALPKNAEGQRFTGDVSRAEIARQQQSEAIRVARVQRDMQEGFILTKYFYEQLGLYERNSQSLGDAIGAMVYGMDVDQVRRQARNIQFVRPSHVVDEARGPGLQTRDASLAKPTGGDADPLAKASEALSKGDTQSALTLAQQATQSKQGDPGRAMFLAAQAHALQGEMTQAEQSFEQALALTKDPHTVAWSHIYLGRIDDIKQDRPAAINQYKAALDAKSGLPDAIAAAQKGIAEPYSVPRHE